MCRRILIPNESVLTFRALCKISSKSIKNCDNRHEDRQTDASDFIMYLIITVVRFTILVDCLHCKLTKFHIAALENNEANKSYTLNVINRLYIQQKVQWTQKNRVSSGNVQCILETFVYSHSRSTMSKPIEISHMIFYNSDYHRLNGSSSPVLTATPHS